LEGKIKGDQGKTITARRGKQQKDYESKTAPCDHCSDKQAKIKQ
jgi:hypothetical protein